MHEVKDAIEVFANTLDAMMEEEGLSLRSYRVDELTSIIKECNAMLDSIWAEFLQHVIYGDAKRGQTLGTIRASLRGMYG